MKTTRELLHGIKKDYCKNVDVTDLVRYLDKVQRALFLVNAENMVYMNGADTRFPYPILETQEGVLEYEITRNSLVDSNGDPLVLTYGGAEVDAAEVTAIFRRVGYSDQYNLMNSNDNGYGSYYYPRRANYFTNNRQFMLWGEWFNEMPYKLVTRSPSNPNPKIIFQCDPGTRTVADANAFFIEVSVAPPPVSTVNSELVIDIDKWEDALIDGVQGEVERILYLEASKKSQLFYTKWIPLFRKYANENLPRWKNATIKRRPYR